MGGHTNCAHHHHDAKEKADFLTNIAAGGDLMASLLSDSFFLAQFFDVATGLAADAFGVSFYGMGFGALIALLSAAGAAYTHRVLNVQHQKVETHCKHTAQSQKDPIHEYQSEPDVEVGREGEEAFLSQANENNQGMQEHKHCQHEHHQHKHKHASLTWKQWFALMGDAVSHTSDIAGPLTFIVELATGSSLSRWAKGIAYCGATLFGAVSTAANVRTCKNAMLKQNGGLVT